MSELSTPPCTFNDPCFSPIEAYECMKASFNYLKPKRADGQRALRV